MASAHKKLKARLSQFKGRLATRYGLSVAEYEAMLLRQDGKCAACGRGETCLGRGGMVKSLGIDHCHKTGAIRGLLCHDCNLVLGHVRDSPTLLRRLAAYLEVTDRSKIDADKAIAELKGDSSCLAA